MADVFKNPDSALAPDLFVPAKKLAEMQINEKSASSLGHDEVDTVPITVKPMASVAPLQKTTHKPVQQQPQPVHIEAIKVASSSSSSSSSVAPLDGRPPPDGQPTPVHEEAVKAPSSTSSSSPSSSVPAHEDVGETRAQGEDVADATPFNQPASMHPVQAEERGQGAAALPSLPQTQVEQTSSLANAAQGRGTEDDKARYHNWLEEKKDLIFLELAEKVMGGCHLRKLALRLGIQESSITNIEHMHPTELETQFYKMFRLYWDRSSVATAFPTLVAGLEGANQTSIAGWLRNRAEIPGQGSSEGRGGQQPSGGRDESGTGPQAAAGGSPGQNAVQRSRPVKEFYDIFIMHAGASTYTRRLMEICARNSWKVKVFNENTDMGGPVHLAISDILLNSSHLVLLITDQDCAKYTSNEMCMTVEMAFQLAYSRGELSGRVIPIRCCNKRSLPLLLQALTGAHIDDESFELRLVETIDTSLRAEREAENQN